MAPRDIFTLTEHCHRELEKRVGERLSAGLTEAQPGEFDKYLDSDYEGAPSRWLRVMRPDFQEATMTVYNDLLDAETARIFSADPSSPVGPTQLEPVDPSSEPSEGTG